MENKKLNYDFFDSYLLKKISSFFDVVNFNYILIANFVYSLIIGIIFNMPFIVNSQYSADSSIYMNKIHIQSLYSGRFARYIINNVLKFLGFKYTNPLSNIFLTIIFLSLISVLFIKLLKIKSYLFSLIITTILVLTPTNIEWLHLNFEVHITYFGLLLSFIACIYILQKSKILGVFLLSIAIGIYQSYLAVALSLISLYYFIQFFVIHDKDINYKSILISYVCVMVSVIFYVIFEKISLIFIGVNDTSVSNYYSMNSLGLPTFNNLTFIVIQFIKSIAIFFIFPFKSYAALNLYLVLKVLYLILLVFSIIAILYYFVNERNKLIFIFGIIILLFSFNCVVFLGDACKLVTIYSMCFNIIFQLIIVYHYYCDHTNSGSLRYFNGFILIFYLILFISFVNNYNFKYREWNNSFNDTKNYLNRLVNAIVLSDNYNPDRKICFTNIKITDWYKEEVCTIDQSKMILDDFYDNTEAGYPSFLGSFRFKEMHYHLFNALRLYASYEPNLVSSEECDIISALPEVQNMPQYPNDGSIKIVNDVLVVKLY